VNRRAGTHRKRVRSVPLTKSFPKGNETDEWRTAFGILISGASVFLIKAGLPKEQLSAELRAAAKRMGSGGARNVRSENYELMVRVSGLVHDWCWDRRFVDPTTGKPSPLPLTGAKASLSSLVARRLPTESTSIVVAWMRHNNVIVRTPEGTFALTRPSVLIANAQPLSLERIATLASQYLETGMHNFRAKDASRRNPDRTARVFDLPAKHLPQFREFVRQQTQTFLETIDDWLESRSAVSTRGRTVEAGVHAYAYTGAPKSRRTALINRARRF
jgi:hypothetical protein